MGKVPMHRYAITGQHMVSVPFTLVVWAASEEDARDFVDVQAYDLDIAAPHSVVETLVETLEQSDA